MSSPLCFSPLFHRGISFSALEALQQQLRTRVLEDNSRAFLLFSEPLPTLTAGISASESDLLWPVSEYSRQGIALERVHRGGKWTYHGPGQIVVYPIFKLSTCFPRTRVRGYLDAFRSALQGAIQSHLPSARLTAGPDENPFGLYHENGQPPSYEKVVSFGVGIQRGVTAHGAAVYHSGPQTFPGIIPCGMRSGRQTSMEQLGWQLPWRETAELLAHSIAQEFENTPVKGFSSEEKMVVYPNEFFKEILA